MIEKLIIRYVGRTGWGQPATDSAAEQTIDSNTKKLRKHVLSAASAPAGLKADVPPIRPEALCLPYHPTLQQPYFKSGADVLATKVLAEQYFQQSRVSCALTFAIVGFMKAGTTYVYDLLASHPQVVKNLKVPTGHITIRLKVLIAFKQGVGFKETGCYLPSSLRNNSGINRMDCFPFVQEGDTSVSDPRVKKCFTHLGVYLTLYAFR
jgi:hypothetical protein